MNNKIINNDKEYIDQYNRIVRLDKIKSKKVLIFVSIYCIRCIQLLPNLNEILNMPDVYPVIFSNGEQDENLEMSELFPKQISIISLSEQDMINDFEIKLHPSYIIITDNHLDTGNIQSIEQLINKIKE